MQSLTQRKQDAIWGNKWNIMHVFETYFTGRNIYMAENTSSADKNIISNGDFEEDDGWTLGGGAAIDRSARFSKDDGLLFNTAGSCAQDVEGLDPAVYVFHFFLKGKCGVQVVNGDGRYWNAKTLTWSVSPVTNNYNNAEWDNASFFLKIVDTTDITISFLGAGEIGFIDYVRLYKKEMNPSYTLVVNYEGYTVTMKTLHLAAGEKDPNDKIPDYSKENYFDNSFMVGSESSYAQEIYQDILDTVRPQGIKVYVEFVERAAE
jgi:hypothetical protein